jgi:hypothetical protein
MRPRAFLAIPIAAAALLGAAVASADSTTVRDAVGESVPLRQNPRVDIVKAIAGHQGYLLKHTVVVNARIDPDRRRERPLIGINTRGSDSSDPEYLVYGDDIFKNPKKGKPKRIGKARLTGKGKRWVYRFDPEQFPHGGLGRYGWAAFTTTAKALDVVPNNFYAIHRP